ncbi:MAG: aromatic ring-hydroxylating oxygenase subunit alpha [Bacteroidota bacterium]
MKNVPTQLPDFSEELLASEPLERAQTIPSTWYTAPEYFEFEKECIFSRSWQNVGHVSQVAKAGDHIIATVADNPVIVVRGKDNVLRAFYNVCRHRGGPLATCNGNTEHVLQCHYHGWTYFFDGQLRGVPDWDRVELFDKKDYGLVPIRLECWEGLIFVNLAASPEPLLKSFGGIVERIAPMNLGAMKFHRRITYDVQCNWKVYADNYLEGYHLPIVHPELSKMLDYRQYVTEVFERYSLQHSPFSGKENLYTSGDGNAFYYFVFPNFMLNILPGRLQTNIILPVSHNKTTIVFDYYYDDVTSSEAISKAEGDIAYSDKIQEEDREICEHVQRGLMSKAYHRGRFSVKREAGVHHFQNLLKEAYRNA